MRLPTEPPMMVDGETILQTYLNLTVAKPSTARTNGASDGKTTRYGASALKRECEIVRNAPEGTRNDTLNIAALKIGSLVASGEISEQDAISSLSAAAVSVGLEDDEIVGTLASGMGKGKTQPREAPEGMDVYPGFGEDIPDMWSVTMQVSLPRIVVNGQQLAALRADTMGAIRASVALTPWLPPVAQFGNQLARIVSDDETGATRLALCNEHSLRHVLTEVAEWVRITYGKNDTVIQTDVPPPMDVVRDIFHAPPWAGVPRCDGVKEHPVIVDGKLIATPGFNAAAKLYIAGEAIALPPTGMDESALADAVALVEEVFEDFPFVTASDRVHAYAILLTAIARPMIKGPVPFFVVEAPTPGTGKTLALKLIERILTGRDAAMQTLGKREEETQKMLFSVISRGGEIVVFDNASGHIDSPSLAGALTATVWSDRILGASQVAEFPVQSIFCASGNGLTLSDELFRRSVFLQLDANMERPEDRTAFRHANIEEWVAQNRTRILAALLVIAQAWIDRNCPTHDMPMGSYESWVRIVGGMMNVAGWGNDLLRNRESIRANKAPDKEPLREFVEAWAARYGIGVEVGARKLYLLADVAQPLPPGITLTMQEIQEREQYAGLLADQLGGAGSEGRRRSLGKLLLKVQNQVISGYKLRQVRRSNGEMKYMLEAKEVLGI